MIHPKLVVPLTAVVMAAAGWTLRGLSAISTADHSAAQAGPSAVSRPSVVPPGTDFQAARKRPVVSQHRVAGRQGLHENLDGSVTVPADLVDRIRVRIFGAEGKVDRGELALLGVDEEKADRLQALADTAKADEKARQSRRAKVLRNEEDGTTLIVPSGQESGSSGNELKRKIEDAAAAILGESNKLVAGSFIAGMSEVTRSWSEETLIIDTRMGREGKREYRVFTYRGDYGFTPPADGAIDPLSLADKSFGQRVYRSEDIPEDLKHLFK